MLNFYNFIEDREKLLRSLKISSCFVYWKFDDWKILKKEL